jgi:hypothetical protein
MKFLKTAAIGLTLSTSLALAQETPRQNGGGGFDPAALRAMIEQYQRNQLGATEEEWTVLAPKIQKVNNARMIAGIGGGFGGGMMTLGRGGGANPNGGGGFNRDALLAGIMGTDAETLAKNPMIIARRELDAVVANKDSTVEQVNEKLKAYRDARAKAQEELKKAQDDLRSVLTNRQEALLTINGTLD